MKSTIKPTGSFSSPERSPTATSCNRKPPSVMRSSSCAVSPIRQRFLLKSTTANSWLADHSVIQDDSQLFTDDPLKALRFATVEAATQRARMVLHIIPDLVIDLISLPL